MSDFSWIAPATKNIANLFGLNPQAAAEGRKLQAEQDYLAARTANTQADTNLSAYRQKVLEAQAGAQGALGTKYGADATLTGSKTKEQEMRNSALSRLITAASASTKNVVGADGKTYTVVDNDMLGQTINPVDITVALGKNAKDAEGGLTANLARSNITSGDPEKVRTGTILSGQATAGGNPNFAANGEIAQGMRTEREEAATNRGVKVAETRGTIAQNIGGAPRAIDLTRAANDAVKLGPEYIQSRYGQSGTSLTGSDKPFPIPEDLSLQITAAAQQKYPQLPINQAIDKVIAESGITFDTRGNFNPFISNETRAYARPNSNPKSDAMLIGSDEKGMTLADVFARSGVAPAAAAAAPAPVAPVAPVAPRSTAPASSNGVTMERMVSVPGQPAPTAPAAPAAQGMPDKAQFAAMPEGATVVVKGVKYVKQGRQLVKAQ